MAADFGSNHVWTVRVENGQAFDFTLRDSEVTVNGGALDQIASFAVDGSGRLYAVGLDGEIFRLTPADEAQPQPPASGGGDGDGDKSAEALAAGAIVVGALATGGLALLGGLAFLDELF